MNSKDDNDRRLIIAAAIFISLAGAAWVFVAGSAMRGGRMSGAIAPMAGAVRSSTPSTPAAALRDCWRNTKTGTFLAIYPLDSDPDPAATNHRTRPDLRRSDGTIIPGADFVRAPDGWWIDAVTGQSAISVPDDSAPDPENSAHRLLLKATETGGEDEVIGRVERVPCPHAGTPAGAGAAAELDRESGDILAEINRVRTHPSDYADELLKGSQAPIMLEAAAFLRKQTPLPPLNANDSLAVSAARHVDDQGRTGGRSHISTDGSTVRQRVAAAGLEPSLVGEEIAFSADTGAGVVRQLIVDDGIPDRGHRTSLFNKDLAAAGAACGPHSLYRSMCVIDIAGPTQRVVSQTRQLATNR